MKRPFKLLLAIAFALGPSCLGRLRPEESPPAPPGHALRLFRAEIRRVLTTASPKAQE